MKKLLVVFLVCVQICLFSVETDFYLHNIGKALEVSQFGFKQDIEDLFVKIYEKENEYPDYIHCVTAQDSLFLAYQIIAKELYLRLYGMPRENFEFLRFPTQELLKTKEEFFLRYPSLILTKDELAKEFKTSLESLDEAITDYEKKDEDDYLKISKGEEEEGDDSEEENEETPSRFQINDTNVDVTRELVSANFTMETYRPLDSALFVFLSGNSVSLSVSQDNFINILSEIFEPLSLPKEKLLKCLEKLYLAAPRSTFGIINQIFIPKESAPNIMYLSFGGGLLHTVYDESFEKSILEFQNNRQTSSFRTFRNFQARILAGALFYDPQIKIFRYSLIPIEKEEKYRVFVKKTLDELLS